MFNPFECQGPIYIYIYMSSDMRNSGGIYLFPVVSVFSTPLVTDIFFHGPPEGLASTEKTAADQNMGTFIRLYP